MLDDWPSISLTEWGVCDVGAAEFHDRMTRGPAGGPPIRLPVSAAVDRELRFNDIMAAPERLSDDPEIRELLTLFVRDRHYHSKASYLHFLPEPCYLVLETGVVLTRRGAILQDTVFPSIGRDSIERQVGGGVTKETLGQLLTSAPVTEDGIWSPLLSRWSQVYDHVFRECLGQEWLLESAGLAGRFAYAVPAKVSGQQRIAIDNAAAPIRRFEAPIARLPAVVFSSIPYDHWAFAEDFVGLVRSLHARPSVQVARERARSCERVYISRRGATARPLRNETQLIGNLERLGFEIFSGYGMTLDEQAAAFGSARLIVGPHGSGLINAAFAPAGATLLELRALHRNSEGSMWGREYRTLCAYFGHEYAVHISRNPLDADEWELDIPEAMSVIELLLDQKR
jgi:capsular polysaccharide biosynthesis protein